MMDVLPSVHVVFAIPTTQLPGKPKDPAKKDWCVTDKGLCVDLAKTEVL
jgi:hypothetical protein